MTVILWQDANPMAMSVGELSDDAPMSEINVIPLVDIMLVLLIIFLITVPVVLETVNLKLPDVAFEPTTTKPENVLLSVRRSEEHTSELQSLMRISYAVFCLKKKQKNRT